MTHVYDVHEISLEAAFAGNPYLDVTLFAVFSQGNRTVRVTGFHDGGEMSGPAVRQVVPRDRGDHHVAQAQFRRRFGHAAGR